MIGGYIGHPIGGVIIQTDAAIPVVVAPPVPANAPGGGGGQPWSESGRRATRKRWAQESQDKDALREMLRRLMLGLPAYPDPIVLEAVEQAQQYEEIVLKSDPALEFYGLALVGLRQSIAQLNAAIIRAQGESEEDEDFLLLVA